MTWAAKCTDMGGLPFIGFNGLGISRAHWYPDEVSAHAAVATHKRAVHTPTDEGVISLIHREYYAVCMRNSSTDPYYLAMEDGAGYSLDDVGFRGRTFFVETRAEAERAVVMHPNRQNHAGDVEIRHRDTEVPFTEQRERAVQKEEVDIHTMKRRIIRRVLEDGRCPDGRADFLAEIFPIGSTFTPQTFAAHVVKVTRTHQTSEHAATEFLRHVGALPPQRCFEIRALVTAENAQEVADLFPGQDVTIAEVP